ncbi:cytochrome c oxidase subunit II [Labilibaculum manganireducens]|uniref:Cytochrome c oxidase subunit 2 n=1 Tax=Labilibaculum manganireducens TaxID=1940525 RepID=A0A2N3IFE1_9BACT|nr:cytochrome c oxidase subunit II [Labilibaculum manganireducens]PKQ69042.1 cytochrome c oxidase subunit II [Labilibaculum manganireducens]
MTSKAIPDASNFVKGVDTSFEVILGIIFFFLIAITATMIYFVFRYRKEKNPVATQIHGSVSLEIIWTVIPTILVMVMFYYGWMGYKPMKEVPDDAFVVKSVGRMWNWQFEYENGKRTDTLYVPLNRAVKLDLKALDVIHSLYIPSFRLKQDVVPGKKQMMWFIPGREGEYDLFCTEYCGLRHSSMQTSVIVMPQDKFDSWYIDTTKTAPLISDKPGALGLIIVKKNGCLACHSLDGSKLVGPSWKGLFGKTETVITNGQSREINVDTAYVINSVYNPNDDVVKGFNKGLMLSYKNELTEDDIGEIIEFMKTLSD